MGHTGKPRQRTATCDKMDTRCDCGYNKAFVGRIFMADDYELDQESARALVDAGYMPLSEYLDLCKQNGWTSQVPAEREKPKRQAFI